MAARRPNNAPLAGRWEASVPLARSSRAWPARSRGIFRFQLAVFHSCWWNVRAFQFLKLLCLTTPSQIRTLHRSQTPWRSLDRKSSWDHMDLNKKIRHSTALTSWNCTQKSWSFGAVTSSWSSSSSSWGFLWKRITRPRLWRAVPNTAISQEYTLWMRKRTWQPNIIGLLFGPLDAPGNTNGTKNSHNRVKVLSLISSC